MQLIWFRNDLRIRDNTALQQALSHGSCIALYIVSRKQWQQHNDAPVKIQFQLNNLRQLKAQLATLNIPLLIRHVDLWQDIPQQLVDLCQTHNIRKVHCNRESPINEQLRDQQCAQLLSQHHIAWRSYNDHLLFQPGAIITQKGECYQVFTQFKKACIKQIALANSEPTGLPKAQAKIALQSDQLTSLEATSELPLWPSGEQAALQRLDQFADNALLDYERQRDFPALSGTSCLSPYLASGVLSIRQCWQRALMENQFALDYGNQGILTWINELLWREFYHHIVKANPKLSYGHAFREKTQFIQWRNAPNELQAWQQGQTGFPLIDAAMQQLLHTGWMHNRLRMVVAMFLTKNLLINWRAGEAWFMQHLVDGEFAANNGGWQWSASTGTDSVPYFRVFNPISQSKRFDAEGSFIRRWLPQLQNLDNKQIHQPDAAIRAELNYPAPMVDLAKSRERVLQVFKAL